MCSVEIDIDFQFQSSMIRRFEIEENALLVCHCNGVSDRAIRRAVRDGADSLAEVGFHCGAGTCCGGCGDAIQQIIHTESSQREPSAPASPNSGANA